MISLLLVNYRAAKLAVEAIRTARAASSDSLQVVVVDNSVSASEAEVLRSHADVLIVSPVNAGYSGGINAGRRACTGDVIVVTNPDVTFGSTAIDRLVESLDGAAVTGPALFWDDAYRWMLPPGRVHTAAQKMDEVLAGRSQRWRFELDRRRFLQRVRFWSLEGPTQVQTLSGAVMAIRTKDMDEAGGFDERFPLYFEETDFLRRMRSLRRRIVYVPAARCRHIYDQSASIVAEEAAAKYAQSELRYLEKWNGPFAARAMKRLERPLSPLVTSEEVSRDASSRMVEDFVKIAASRLEEVVVEASPLASFSTAAGHFPDGPVQIPDEVLASLRGALYLRVVGRRDGVVVRAYKLTA